MITIPQQWGAQKVNVSKTLNLVFIPMGPTFIDLFNYISTLQVEISWYCIQRKIMHTLHQKNQNTIKFRYKNYFASYYSDRKEDYLQNLEQIVLYATYFGSSLSLLSLAIAFMLSRDSRLFPDVSEPETET